MEAINKLCIGHIVVILQSSTSPMFLELVSSSTKQLTFLLEIPVPVLCHCKKNEKNRIFIVVLMSIFKITIQLYLDCYHNLVELYYQLNDCYLMHKYNWITLILILVSSCQSQRNTLKTKQNEKVKYFRRFKATL